MCFGGPAPSNAAAEARERERKRQEAIREGTEKIDETFGQFDDNFFSGIENDALSFYNPQIKDQFSDASRKLTLNLAQSGNLRSSSGARQFADLEQRRQEAAQDIANRALAASSDARGRVESARTNLVRQLGASGDPAAAANAALTQAQLLSAPPTFDPVGNFFSQITSNLADRALIQQNQRNRETQSAAGLATTGAGSSRVIA